MGRPSIRTLMVFVGTCAIGFAAFQESKDGAKKLAVLAVLALLATLCGSLTGASVLYGRDRSWCIGVSILCAAVLVVWATFVGAIALIGGD